MTHEIPRVPADAPLTTGEGDLVNTLRRGDEDAFLALVERHHEAMVRTAMVYVGRRAVAEEVVQETWLAVIRGLDGFAGRSSLKTWIFSILANRARSWAVREGRSLPFSTLTVLDEEGSEPAVEPERFLPPGHPDAGWWTSYPRDWAALPEARLLASEVRARVAESIAALPATQRAVITLRDVEGWSAQEVCKTLEISEGNQRVLLHRARSTVRRTLEHYLEEESRDDERP